MPLHEPPLQKCGTGHWLTDPCPKGECHQLVFEKDTVKLRPVSTNEATPLEVEPEPEVTPDGPVKPMTPAEKQKLWRQKNAEKVRAANRERMRRKRGG